MQPSKRSPRKAAQPKSRSVVPIPSTIETVKGFPDKLVIFKVPASPFWWVRYHDGKPIKRSTKTESKPEAIRFAKSFYESILVNNALGHSNNSRQKSFMLCAEAVIKEDEEKARRKELAARYVSTQKALINNHIKRFFRNYEIGDVDYSVLDRFKTYLFEQELVSSSVKLHFVSVKKIFGHAQRHGIIKVAPLFPKIKQEDNPRAYFKLHQYVKLRRVARRLAGYVAKVKQSNLNRPGFCGGSYL